MPVWLSMCMIHPWRIFFAFWLRRLWSFAYAFFVSYDIINFFFDPVNCALIETGKFALIMFFIFLLNGSQQGVNFTEIVSHILLSFSEIFILLFCSSKRHLADLTLLSYCWQFFQPWLTLSEIVHNFLLRRKPFSTVELTCWPKFDISIGYFVAVWFVSEELDLAWIFGWKRILSILNLFANAPGTHGVFKVTVFSLLYLFFVVEAESRFFE